MTEFWLQKKTIGGWSMVTWYDNEEQARKNYDNCRTGKGYAWRLVKVEVLELQPLEDMIEIVPPEVEKPQERRQSLKIVDPWGDTKIASNSISDNPIWNEGHPTADNVPVISVPSVHGLSGSIWVVHHGQRIKSRVALSDLDSYLNNGYVRGGPKTQFRS